MNTGYLSRASFILAALLIADDTSWHTSNRARDKGAIALLPSGSPELVSEYGFDGGGFLPGERPADYTPEQTYPVAQQPNAVSAHITVRSLDAEIALLRDGADDPEADELAAARIAVLIARREIADAMTDYCFFRDAVVRKDGKRRCNGAWV